MSLNKTLDRFFDEIRREAKRNPDFANRLDAVLQRHDSRRDVPDEVLEVAARDETPPRKRGRSERSEGRGRSVQASRTAPSAGCADSSRACGEHKKAPAINPAGLYKREGEDALRKALEGQELSALRALVAEHNLDPSGVTPSLTRDEIAAHILAQAKRRAERDEKMFDY
ncbi:MAG: hypothetical protein M0D54_07615 [Hyphomonadaceae bacterium JAD_PAG50586_4]|nr:MAG: hypothetical protein M0D54_07615 [Hyphomonadaceae bacterium JAD_PAG50586_4]